MRDSWLRHTPLPGHGVGPKQLDDLVGLEIEMVSEQVDLTLLMDGNSLKLDVDVTFMFRNHADTDTVLDVCYPIGVVKNVSGFQCETDGTIHEVTERKELLKKGRWVTLDAWFYDWSATFPAGQAVMHKVKYRLNLDLKDRSHRTGYTVSSGGPWKGKISKSVITLSGSKEAWSHIRNIGPLAGAEESGTRLVWRYTDYDPAPEHDIWIEFSRELTLEDQCKTYTKGHLWSERSKEIMLRARACISTGKLSLNDGQLRNLRTSLIGLVSQAETEGKKVTLPEAEKRMVLIPSEQTEPPEYVERVVKRPYLVGKRKGALEVFRWLNQVALVAKGLPDEPETKKLLEVWGSLLDAHIRGELFAGETELTSKESDLVEWKKQMAGVRGGTPADNAKAEK